VDVVGNLLSSATVKMSPSLDSLLLEPEGGNVMSVYEVRTAADLVDPVIHTKAPLYALAQSSGLVERTHINTIQNRAKRPLRFMPGSEALVIDRETDARWEPLSPDCSLHNWAYGQVTLHEQNFKEYYRDYAYEENLEALLPEIFVRNDDLIVSERVRDLVGEFAPGFCYFSPIKIVHKNTGKSTEAKYFKAFLRRRLTYVGGSPQKLYPLPWGRLHPIPKPDWTALCNSAEAKTLAYELPIFAVGLTKYPILSSELYQLLKREGVSGLLELSELYVPDEQQLRPPSFHEFETVYPLDPDAQLRAVTP